MAPFGSVCLVLSAVVVAQGATIVEIKDDSLANESTVQFYWGKINKITQVGNGLGEKLDKSISILESTKRQIKDLKSELFRLGGVLIIFNDLLSDDFENESKTINAEKDPADIELTPQNVFKMEKRLQSDSCLKKSFEMLMQFVDGESLPLEMASGKNVQLSDKEAYTIHSSFENDLQSKMEDLEAGNCSDRPWAKRWKDALCKLLIEQTSDGDERREAMEMCNSIRF